MIHHMTLTNAEAMTVDTLLAGVEKVATWEAHRGPLKC